MSDNAPHVPYRLPRHSDAEMRHRLQALHIHMEGRRSVRHFSPDPVPMEVLEKAIQHCRDRAERSPQAALVAPPACDRPGVAPPHPRGGGGGRARSYHGRMSQQWLDDLVPLGTDHVKPFIEEAPALIIVFRKVYDRDADTGEKNPNYYVQESCGIAVGLLLAALHEAGLAGPDPRPRR